MLYQNQAHNGKCKYGQWICKKEVYKTLIPPPRICSIYIYNVLADDQLVYDNNPKSSSNSDKRVHPRELEIERNICCTFWPKEATDQDMGDAFSWERLAVVYSWRRGSISPEAEDWGQHKGRVCYDCSYCFLYAESLDEGPKCLHGCTNSLEIEHIEINYECCNLRELTVGWSRWKLGECKWKTLPAPDQSTWPKQYPCQALWQLCSETLGWNWGFQTP